MRRVFASLVSAAAVLWAGGCDQLGLGPHRAASARRPPAAPAAVQLPDLRAHTGETYADFVAQPGMERYSLTALGLSHDEQARFTYAMAHPAVGTLASGGGRKRWCSPAARHRGAWKGSRWWRSTWPPARPSSA